MIRHLFAAALLCAVVSSGMNPAFATDFRGLVTTIALTAGVPEDIAHAVIQIESGYNPHARGAAGEWGLGQIKCQTARGLGFRGGCGALADPATNLRFSLAYLRLALDRGGQGCSGVSLYQRGLYGRASCSAYGLRVMRRARHATPRGARR